MAPAQIGRRDVQAVGLGGAVDACLGVDADAEAAAPAVWRRQLEERVAVVALRGHQQQRLALAAVDRQPFDVGAQRLAQADGQLRLGRRTRVGAQPPHAAVFLADEELVAGLVHHAALGLAGEPELAAQRGLPAATRLAQQLELAHPAVLVVDDGLEPPGGVAQRADAVHIVQPGGQTRQLAHPAVGAVDAEQHQRSLVALRGHRQVEQATAVAQALAQIDVVDAPDRQELPLPTLQVVDQQALLLVGGEDARALAVAWVHPQRRVVGGVAMAAHGLGLRAGRDQRQRVAGRLGVGGQPVLQRRRSGFGIARGVDLQQLASLALGVGRQAPQAHALLAEVEAGLGVAYRAGLGLGRRGQGAQQARRRSVEQPMLAQPVVAEQEELQQALGVAVQGQAAEVEVGRAPAVQRAQARIGAGLQPQQLAGVGVGHHRGPAPVGQRPAVAVLDAQGQTVGLATGGVEPAHALRVDAQILRRRARTQAQRQQRGADSQQASHQSPVHFRFSL